MTNRDQQLIHECFKALGKDRPGMVKVWVDDEQDGGWFEFVTEAEATRRMNEEEN